MLIPNIIFDDVPYNIKSFTKFCTTSMSIHPNTNRHAITDNIKIMFEYIISVTFSINLSIYKCKIS